LSKQAFPDPTLFWKLLDFFLSNYKPKTYILRVKNLKKKIFQEAIPTYFFQVVAQTMHIVWLACRDYIMGKGLKMFCKHDCNIDLP